MFMIKLTKLLATLCSLLGNLAKTAENTLLVHHLDLLDKHQADTVREYYEAGYDHRDNYDLP